MNTASYLSFPIPFRFRSLSFPLKKGAKFAKSNEGNPMLQFWKCFTCAFLDHVMRCIGALFAEMLAFSVAPMCVTFAPQPQKQVRIVALRLGGALSVAHFSAKCNEVGCHWLSLPSDCARYERLSSKERRRTDGSCDCCRRRPQDVTTVTMK